VLEHDSGRVKVDFQHAILLDAMHPLSFFSAFILTYFTQKVGAYGYWYFVLNGRNGAKSIQMETSRNALPGYSRKLFQSTPSHPLLTLNAYQVGTTV